MKINASRVKIVIPYNIYSIIICPHRYNPGLTYNDFVFVTTTNGIIQVSKSISHKLF